MRRRAGFTFMEVLLVVMIVSVLATITMPRMKGSFQQARIKSAARDVTGILRYARNAAVLREKPVQVRFDPEKDLYQLVLLDINGEPEEEKNRRQRRRDKSIAFTAGDDVSGVRRLPEKVHFGVIYTAAPLTEDTDRPCIEYYADGSATPATIVIQDDAERTINVEIFRTTGMARVEKGLPKRKPRHQTLYYGPELEDRTDED